MSNRLKLPRNPVRVRADAAPTVTEIAEAIRGVQSAFAQFREKNDAALAELRTGRDDVVRREELDRINAAISAREAELTELNRRVQLAGLTPDNGNGFSAEDRAHTASIVAYMRRATPPQATASVGSDPDGGYLVGEEIEAGIERILGTLSVMRQLATVRSIGAASYRRLRGLGGATSGWVGETATRSETNTPQLGFQDFPTHEIYAMPAATQTLLDDAETDVVEWLADEVAIEFDEEEGDAWINGDGTNKPRGLIGGYTPIANGSFVATGSRLGYLATGVSAGFTVGSSPANNPVDILIDLVHALKAQVRNGARWLMSDLTLAEVRKIKDADGNYIWQPGAQAGVPSTLLGYAVSSDDNMPDIAANSYSIAFGDFRRTYLILDRVGVRTLRDPFSSKPYVLFYTTKRVGGGIQNFEACKLLKFGTS